MMNRITVLILLLGHSVYGQEGDLCSIRGRLLDSVSKTPVAGAEIAVSDKNGLVLSPLISGSDGFFLFGSKKRLGLKITARAMGYAPRTFSVSADKTGADSLDIGDIHLVPRGTTLEEVAVTGKKNLISQEIGKIVYDVQADPENQSQNLFEMLRKVPMMSVTAEDDLLMSGKGNFKVLIDGKTSALTVGRPSDIFKTIPARLVRKIEVITQPPAKYDSEGLGGILNVVMDQKLVYGYLGGINASSGKMASSTGGNFAIRFNKVSISTFLNGFWEYPPESRLSSLAEREGGNGRVLQDGSIKNRADSKIGVATIGYEIDTLNLLLISANVRGNTHDRFNPSNSEIFSPNANARSFSTDNRSASNGSGRSFDVNYERGFAGNKQQLLTFSFSHNKRSNRKESHNIYGNRTNFDDADFRQLNHSDFTEQIGQVDYVHPLGDIEMSVGAKLTDRNGSSRFYAMIPMESSGTDGSDENTFANRQRIYAVYNAYSLKRKDWGMSFGVRFEGTDNRADFYSTGTTIGQKYNRFIPSVLFSKKNGNTSSLNFGYTQRVQRPDINLMNPFVDRSDPTFYFAGNPGLSPVTSHSFSASHSWFRKGFINIGSSYSLANNTVQRVVELGADNVSHSTYHNIGKDKRLDLNLAVNYPVTRAIHLSLNSTASYVDIKGTVQGKMHQNHGVQGNGYAYLNYSLKNTVRLNGSMGFYSPVVVLQGSTNGYLYHSFSASKQVMKNKATVFASVTNPFQKYRNVENRILSDGFRQVHSYRNYFRNFSLGLSYNFGKLEKPIKKNKRGIKTEDKLEKTEKSEKGGS